MTVKDLVGFQLVELDDEKMLVRKDGKTYMIKFDTDDGDCCGYAEVEAKLFVENGSPQNPVITNVKYVEEDLSDGDWSDGGGNNIVITLFGELGITGQIESVCGSGSGWQYGATVTLECDELDIREVICSW